MTIDSGQGTLFRTSYDRAPVAASLLGSQNSTSGWLNLPCHQPLWAAADAWWNQGQPSGQLRVQGGPGTGKSFWLQELNRRLRPFRTRLISAEIANGQRADRHQVYQQWATHLARDVEPARRMKLEEWVPLALKALATDGYVVILAIEADHTPRPTLPGYPLIYLQRIEFQGLNNHYGLVLPPWSNDELAAALGQAWPGHVWPDAVVEKIWLQTVGQPRLVMNLAERLAKRANAAGAIAIDLAWIEEKSLIERNY